MEITILASGSSGNCYRVDDGKTAILLDAGISIKEIQRGCRFQLSKIKGCLVTHCHGDHSKAVNNLLRRGVDCYMPLEEAAECAVMTESSRFHALKPDAERPSGFSPFQIGSWFVLPFKVEHDTPNPVGYLLSSTYTREKLLYFTDTYYLRYTFTGVTHIIGECNYDEDTLWNNVGTKSVPNARVKRLFESHMSLSTFLDLLRANNKEYTLQQIYIAHMSDCNGNEERIKTAVQQLTGAEVYVC